MLFRLIIAIGGFIQRAVLAGHRVRSVIVRSVNIRVAVRLTLFTVISVIAFFAGVGRVCTDRAGCCMLFRLIIAIGGFIQHAVLAGHRVGTVVVGSVNVGMTRRFITIRLMAEIAYCFLCAGCRAACARHVALCVIADGAADVMRAVSVGCISEAMRSRRCLSINIGIRCDVVECLIPRNGIVARVIRRLGRQLFRRGGGAIGDVLRFADLVAFKVKELDFIGSC